jgi:ATP synthase protein I
MVLILVVGVAYLIIVGWFWALSAIYGGGMAMLRVWMLAKRVRFASEIAKNMPGREVEVLYRGAIQRFVFILALFIIGMAVMGLEPVALLVGFTVPQGAFLLSTYFSGFRFGG